MVGVAEEPCLCRGEVEMPFKSAKQRALFHAMKVDPELREKYGISMREVMRMLAEDTGGKLPMRVSDRTRKAVGA